MKEDIFYLTDESGVKREYYILFTFKENNKHYVIYTDYEKNDEGIINTFYGYYNNSFEDEGLKEIIDENDIKLIKKILNEIIENIE